MKNNTLDGKEIGLQVSKVGNIPEGSFILGLPFYIKNNTVDLIEVSVKYAGTENFITTVMFPGWNPELIEEIQNNTVTTLQYGR